MGIFIGFALLFSTSSFANTNTMQMPVEHSASVHNVVATQVDSHHTQAMSKIVKDSHDCCTDDEKIPCDDDGDCKMPCMSFSHSYAVLTQAGSPSAPHSLAVITANTTLNDGIFSALNAPPPRA